MRLTVVVFGELTARSGGYRYDMRLVEALGRRGHRVDVVSQPDNLPYHRQAALDREPGWIERVCDTGPDVVLIDELNHAAWNDNLDRLRHAFAGPVIAIVHHLRSDETTFGRIADPFSLGARRREARFLRGVDACVVNSGHTEKRVRRITGGRVGVHVAYPGADITPSLFDDRSARTVHRLSGTVRVLFVGAIHPRKRLIPLIRAVARVNRRRRGSPVVLTVVGDRSKSLRYAAVAMRLAGRRDMAVRFIGAATDGELAGLLMETDVLAVPSAFEGFGIVYLEACSFSAAVVGTTRGGAREIIRDNTEGALVDPAGGVRAISRAIGRLTTDEATLERYRRAAGARFRAFPGWVASMDGAVAFVERYG